MICPRCHHDLLGEPNEAHTCTNCGLKRRPVDRIVRRKDTKFTVLLRNIKRTSPGSEVQLVKRESTNPEFSGRYGAFKTNETDVYFLRTPTGLIIASSEDTDDLAILAAEQNWHADDPAEFAIAIERLKHD